MRSNQVKVVSSEQQTGNIDEFSCQLLLSHGGSVDTRDQVNVFSSKKRILTAMRLDECRVFFLAIPLSPKLVKVLGIFHHRASIDQLEKFLERPMSPAPRRERQKALTHAASVTQDRDTDAKHVFVANRCFVDPEHRLAWTAKFVWVFAAAESDLGSATVVRSKVRDRVRAGLGSNQATYASCSFAKRRERGVASNDVGWRDSHNLPSVSGVVENLQRSGVGLAATAPGNKPDDERLGVDKLTLLFVHSVDCLETTVS
jgi:hypothetical protein